MARLLFYSCNRVSKGGKRRLQRKTDAPFKTPPSCWPERRIHTCVRFEKFRILRFADIARSLLLAPQHAARANAGDLIALYLDFAVHHDEIESSAVLVWLHEGRLILNLVR